MATTSASLCLSKRLSVYLRGFPVICHLPRTVGRCYTTSESAPKVEYPPIKPKYPPGTWGDLEPKVAWALHEQTEEIQKISAAKERLEHIAGSTDVWLHQLAAIHNHPGTLPMKQLITKTAILKGLPEALNNISISDEIYNRLKPSFLDVLVTENEHHLSHKLYKPTVTSDSYLYKKTVGALVRTLLATLSVERPYLLRSQLDESVRLESFCTTRGFNIEEKDIIHTTAFYKTGLVRSQIKCQASFQIRTEMPLPEFISKEDNLCSEADVPSPRYLPKTIGIHYLKGRPLSVSGHWIGDPCEFNLVTYQVPGQDYMHFVKKFGEDYGSKEIVPYALLTGFATTSAMAHNQGFNPHVDITSPFTAQIVVTDGQRFRFFAYQLNTLHLWKSNDANPLRNLMWMSEEMKLYDTIESGQVKGLNDDVLKHMIKSVMLMPTAREVDMRPYLSEEAPVKKQEWINEKGTDPPEHPVIGRYQYPRNAVYF